MSNRLYLHRQDQLGQHAMAMTSEETPQKKESSNQVREHVECRGPHLLRESLTVTIQRFVFSHSHLPVQNENCDSFLLTS